MSTLLYIAVGFFASAPIVALATWALASAVGGAIKRAVLR